MSHGSVPSHTSWQSKFGKLMTNEEETRFIPLTDWPKYHPWPPLGGLRHLVFHAKKNGFEEVICKASGRILINEKSFFRWLNKYNTRSKGDLNE
jgi:hypothetical protein